MSLQIGWADHLFRASSGEEVSEDGVGDDEHSWAYDGLRGKKWNKSDIDYGTTLKKSVPVDPVPVPVPASSSSSSKKTTSESKKKGKQESATSAADIIEAAVDATHDPWKEGDVVGCLLDITTGDISVARVSYTLNGISLGIAYEDITAVSKTLKSDKSRSSGSSSGSKDDEAVTPYYYPCFSLEHGEAVLLNIGQRPFAFQPASDINVIHTSVSTIPTTPAITEIIEEKVTKKKPPAKKGKKSKKDIAEELEAEKEAEKEAERIATAAADAATAIATAEALKVSQSIPIIIAPYLPVLNALESSIRDLVPRETSDSESSNSGAAAVALAVSKDKSKGSNATDSSSKELVGGKLASELTPVVLVTEPVVPITYLPVNLESEEFSSDSLENLIVLGLQHLKVELERRGLKAGGSLEDRARRLFSVRGLKENEISAKLKSKASG